MAKQGDKPKKLKQVEETQTSTVDTYSSERRKKQQNILEDLTKMQYKVINDNGVLMILESKNLPEDLQVLQETLRKYDYYGSYGVSLKTKKERTDE